MYVGYTPMLVAAAIAAPSLYMANIGVQGAHTRAVYPLKINRNLGDVEFSQFPWKKVSPDFESAQHYYAFSTIQWSRLAFWAQSPRLPCCHYKFQPLTQTITLFQYKNIISNNTTNPTHRLVPNNLINFMQLENLNLSTCMYEDTVKLNN